MTTEKIKAQTRSRQATLRAARIAEGYKPVSFLMRPEAVQALAKLRTATTSDQAAIEQAIIEAAKNL